MGEDRQTGHEQSRRPGQIPWRKLAEGGVRKGFDQLVDTVPQPSSMSPQEAVAAAEPKHQDSEE